MFRLLIAASGTGGHIFPALSVAESLPQSWEISWLGVPNRLESQIVPGKFHLTTISVNGLQSQGIRKFFDGCKLLFSTISVIRLIRKKKIQIVFTTGGYIAAPAIIGSKLCGIKVVLHESNAFPGKVTRFLGRFCNQVALGVPIAAEKLKGCQLIFTGTPVRRTFLEAKSLPDWVPNGFGPLIVVIGGSQGAIGLNCMVREIIPWLLEHGCRVVHIIGKNETSSTVDNSKFVERVFVEDMPGLLQHADLAISRAGAGSLSELAVCNTPAILIPYPAAADEHQDFNAAYAAQFGAALIIHQGSSGVPTLRRSIKRFLDSYFSTLENSDNLLKKMQEGMQKLGVRDAHLRVANLLKRYTY